MFENLIFEEYFLALIFDGIKSEIIDFVRCMNISLEFLIVDGIEYMKKLYKILEFRLFMKLLDIGVCFFDIIKRLYFLIFKIVEKHGYLFRFK